jgi:hypothetical protein
MIASGSLVVPDSVDSVAARRAYLNEKFGRTGDLNLDINIRAGKRLQLTSLEVREYRRARLNHSLRELILLNLSKFKLLDPVRSFGNIKHPVHHKEIGIH